MFFVGAQAQTMLNNLQAANWKIALDILLVLLLLWGALSGARKGAVQSILGFVSTILAIILAFIFFKKAAVLLEDWFGLQTALAGRMEKVFLKFKYFDTDVSHEGVLEILKGTNLPSFLVKEIADSIGNSNVPAGTTLAMQAGGVVARFISKAIAWLLIFVLVKIILWLFSKITSGVFRKIPLLGAADVLFGVIIGTIKSLFFIYGALALLTLIPIEGITTFINDTYLLKIFYHDNLLMKLIIA